MFNRKEYQKNWQLKNRAKCKEYARLWKLNNRDKAIQSSRLTYQKNKEKRQEECREYYNTHKEKFQNDYKAYRKRYHELHKERIRERAKQYCKKNRLRISEYKSKWAKENKLKMKAYSHEIRAKLRRKHRRFITKTLTSKIIQMVYEDNIKKYGTLTCILCLVPIKFGEDSLEHITPLSRGGTNDYDNLAIAHSVCNSKKGNKTLEAYRNYITPYNEYKKQ